MKSGMCIFFKFFLYFCFGQTIIYKSFCKNTEVSDLFCLIIFIVCKYFI